MEWRAAFTNVEVHALHAETFETKVYDEPEWDWVHLTRTHSLGWVTARGDEGGLAGFVNVLWDGLGHAWVQDTMVAQRARHRGIGVALVDCTRRGAAHAGCEVLHVDFDEQLRSFHIDACGFTPTDAGLIHLTGE